MVARFASLVVGDDAAYLLGNDVRLGPSRVPKTPLTAWTLDGTFIGRPAGDFTFSCPRALLDADKTLQMLWVEPETPILRGLGYTWPNRPFKSVWSAAYRRTTGWSTPFLVYDSPGELLWSESSSGQGYADTLGGGGFVTSESAGMVPDGLLIQLVAGKWTTRKLANTALYSSIASLDGQNVFISYIPALPSGPGDKSSLYFKSSRDGGLTWGPPILIQRGGREPASHPSTLLARDGSLHLIWNQLLADRNVIRHGSTKQGDTAWSSIDELRLPVTAGNFVSAVDACGTLHLVYEVLSNEADAETSHIDHVAWRGRWSPPAHPFPRWRSTDAALAPTRDGKLFIAFLAQPATAIVSSPPASMLASTIACTHTALRG